MPLDEYIPPAGKMGWAMQRFVDDHQRDEDFIEAYVTVEFIRNVV